MLDALFGKSANNKQQIDELQSLVDKARDERAALSAMLTPMTPMPATPNWNEPWGFAADVIGSS